ncbi:MAG TPA: hypothetical protein VFF46_40510, partial [Kribbella sp.]|nr:hypothetical protein [Kribbella sp.]
MAVERVVVVPPIDTSGLRAAAAAGLDGPSADETRAVSRETPEMRDDGSGSDSTPLVDAETDLSESPPPVDDHRMKLPLQTGIRPQKPVDGA